MQDIIIKYLSGNASDEERRTVEAWKEKEGNAQIFDEIRQTWELSGNRNLSFTPDVDKAWQKFSERRTQKRSGRRKVLYYLSAAAVLIPVAIFFLFSREEEIIRESGPVARELAQNVFVEEISSLDSMVVFYLPDSSKVWLNKDSKLSYAEKFVGDTREVKLYGEAFFEVKRMEKVPFVIYTGGSVTRVLGTSFNLKAYEEGNEEITVVSGKVEFAPADSPSLGKVVLTADDKASLDPKEKQVIKSKGTNEDYAWWKRSKKQNKFKKFLSKIKKVFRINSKSETERQ